VIDLDYSENCFYCRFCKTTDGNGFCSELKIPVKYEDFCVKFEVDPDILDDKMCFNCTGNTGNSEQCRQCDR